MRVRSTAWWGMAPLVLALGAPAAVQAQSADAAREAFRTCDAQAFLALNMARNYLMSDRNRGLVLPQVEGDAAGRAMAEDLFDRVDKGQVRHPGQFAADTLFKCAMGSKLKVGASREQAAVCFTRTDVAFLLHGERAKGVLRQKAVATVSAQLKARTLYPMSLINQVAEAVYAPSKPPELRALMGTVAWNCIGGQRAGVPASAPRR